MGQAATTHDWKAIFLKTADTGIIVSHMLLAVLETFLLCGEQIDYEKIGKRMFGAGLKVPVSTGHVKTVQQRAVNASLPSARSLFHNIC